jgi:D-lyxose ketol-isomerase
MKRSEINRHLVETLKFFDTMKVRLPAWGYWTPAQWKGRRAEVAEIVESGLGWDITDFGSGDFARVGLINFNPRNGVFGREGKPYCEKIIVVHEEQVTPLHTHIHKREDIINRGGGNLVIQLQNGDSRGKLEASAVSVKIDALTVTVPAGGKVVLRPGESIYLVPGTYHAFWGEAGRGPVLVGEVSTVNDDRTDNVFIDSNPRFPALEEDEAPVHLLVNDYARFL